MKVNSSKIPIRILWAIDILSQEKRFKKCDERFLRVLSHKTAIHVIPAYVARLVEPLPKTKKDKQELLHEIKNRMDAWLAEIEVPGLADPQILLQGGIYLRSEVDALHSFAKKEKVDLIMVNTHARKGFARFWQGSFSESLMHHSSVPVLFINPSATIPKNIRSIIYPTNLSPDSDKAISKVGQLAKRIGASLVLYNNVEYFVASPSLSFSETMVFDRQIERDVEERKKHLKRTAHKLEKKWGIRVKTKVDSEDISAAEGILKESKKIPSSIIAMLSQTGPVLSNIVGSTTRRVVRGSQEPVFVLK